MPPIRRPIDTEIYSEWVGGRSGSSDDDKSNGPRSRIIINTCNTSKWTHICTANISIAAIIMAVGGTPTPHPHPPLAQPPLACKHDRCDSL